MCTLYSAVLILFIGKPSPPAWKNASNSYTNTSIRMIKRQLLILTPTLCMRRMAAF